MFFSDMLEIIFLKVSNVSEEFHLGIRKGMGNGFFGEQFHCAYAVSYTHLDVYKRQEVAEPLVPPMDVGLGVLKQEFLFCV